MAHPASEWQHGGLHVEEVTQIVDELKVPLHPCSVEPRVHVADGGGEVAIQQSVVLLGDQADLERERERGSRVRERVE